MKKLVLERRELKQNIMSIKTKTKGALLYADLAADAWGAGLMELAAILRDEGISRFAVSELEEAEALRRAGFFEEEILMLRSITDRRELDRLVDLGVVYTIGTYDSGVALNAAAEARSTVLEAHLRIDMSMGTGGFLMDDMEKILSMYQYLPSVAITGIYTQFRGDKNNEPAEVQVRAFQQLLDKIRNAGYETGIVHTSEVWKKGSGGDKGAIRVGSAFLGRGRRTKKDGLKKVGYGEVNLEEPRWLPQGYIVGEESHEELRNALRVASISIGYQNGLGVAFQKEESFWERLFRKREQPVFRINNQRVSVVGGIGARETVLDVTRVKCNVGDIVNFEIDPLYAKGLEREYR